VGSITAVEPAVAEPNAIGILMRVWIRLTVLSLVGDCYSHFYTMSTMNHPKKSVMKICCGIYSKKKSTQFLVYILLSPLRNTPKVIWVMPTMMANFIF